MVLAPVRGAGFSFSVKWLALRAGAPVRGVVLQVAREQFRLALRAGAPVARIKALLQ